MVTDGPALEAILLVYSLRKFGVRPGKYIPVLMRQSRRRSPRPALTSVLAWEIASADLAGALTVILFLALSFVHLPTGGRLPDFFGALVALLNGLGFVFGS